MYSRFPYSRVPYSDLAVKATASVGPRLAWQGLLLALWGYVTGITVAAHAAIGAGEGLLTARKDGPLAAGETTISARSEGPLAGESQSGLTSDPQMGGENIGTPRIDGPLAGEALPPNDRTDRELAAKAGIAGNTVSRYENGSDAYGLWLQAQPIKRALEAGGIIFLDENGGGPRVRLKKRRRK